MSADLPIQMHPLPRMHKVKRKQEEGGLNTGYPPIVARMPPELVARLDAAARVSFRSRSAEMVMRLQASLANESIDEHGVIVVHSPAPRK